MSLNKAKAQALILERLRQAPIIELAVKKAGVSRATYYRWCHTDPIFHQEALYAIEWGREHINDMAESKLIQNLQDNNMTAIIFWLKNNHNRYRTIPLTPQEPIAPILGRAKKSIDDVVQDNIIEIITNIGQRQAEAIERLAPEDLAEVLPDEIKRLEELNAILVKLLNKPPQ